MTKVLEAEAVSKRFGKVQALDGVNLEIEEGQVLAVLGPNGAGKTTFVGTVATLIKPDSGRLTVAGYDVVKQAAQVRSSIGLAGQHAAVEETMTGRENLEMIARLVGHDSKHAKQATARLLGRFDLTEAADRASKTYSGGMRRRLDVAASLLGAPKLVLLDEPTTGLDPVSRVDVWQSIRQLVASGTSVLLTTHYLDEADHLANQVAVIDHGRLIAYGTPAELKRRAGRDVIEVSLRNATDLEAAKGALAAVSPHAVVVDEPLRRLSVQVDTGPRQLADAARRLDDLGISLDDIALRGPTLDEVFMSLTKNSEARAREMALVGSR